VGLSNGITGGIPDTARRKLCKLETGIIHYDFAAFCEETKQKYDKNTSLVPLGQELNGKME
jgi:hypothetical protein